MNRSASKRLAAVGLFTAVVCSAQSPGPGMPLSTAARILEQATWGPTPASVQALQTAGFDKWFASQIAAPITTYPNQPMLGPDGKFYGNLQGVQAQFFENALYNPDQLRQRIAFALSEIWVVSKESNIGYAAAFPPYLNVFQKDAFASYSTLMNDVTLNPAMGHYLNMLNNHKASGAYLPNENYGRELMQLFTIGLVNLNQDGSVANSTPTYYEPTVGAISAALTGWTYAPTAPGATAPNYFLPMVPVESKGLETQHDMSAKTLAFNYPDGSVSTTVFPAGQSAEQDLADVISTLVANPNMAPFISKQLIQHLVTSNPSPAYVQRISGVFKTTNGNLQSVVYQILTDPEARAGDTAGGVTTNFGHLREPILWVENLLRGLNGSVYDTTGVNGYTANLGQSFLFAPSVFSYFSPDYHAGPLSAPEFQLHSTQTAVNRANYTYAAIYGGKLDPSTTFDISAYITAATTSTSTLETAINNQFFHGHMSSTLQAAITSAMTGLTTPTTKAQAGLYIALTSNEFQIMH